MEIYEQEHSEAVTQMPEKKKEIVDLTNSQKLTILSRWNDESKGPPSIDELLLLVFKKRLDGRSKESTVIKRFLVDKGLNAVKEEKALKIELTSEHKEYITNNCQTMKPVEMARHI